MSYAPSSTNVFIPNHEATNGMIADFSRNPNSFALPRYAQYLKVDAIRGFWAEMVVEQAGRVIDAAGEDVLWADGADQPDFASNLESFDWRSFFCKRRVDGVVLGEMLVEQAKWDVLKQHMQQVAQRVMTRRTSIVSSLLTTTGNYLSAHVINVDSPPSGLTGIGNLDAATSSNRDIKKTLDYTYMQINKATLGAVKQRDVHLVMNPVTAQKLSITNEMSDFLKQSPFATQLLQGSLDNPEFDGQWGLPAKLYGYNVCVEDTVRVSTVKGASSTTKGYVWPDGYIAMISRPGALGSGSVDRGSFSTVTLFLKDEMVTETKHDVDHKRHTGRVIDTFDAKITSQLSGALIYNALT